ncbi:MAG: DNA primase, partial [Lachnospiraceae bacterium]
MEKMERASQPETWFDGSKVNDVLFCEDFLAGHPMKCIHSTFFDVNGAIGDAEQIKAEIYYKIAPYVTSGIAKKATTLLDALRIRCYSPPIPYQTDRIHVANGTYFLSGDFSAQKEFCMNRLPVKYLPGAPEPSRWLAFLGQLLVPEDIITLQEFMGYVLLPTTKGQKMMIVIGKGGEGKSRIGRVLRALLGDSMNTGSIQKVEVDRFARADLEWKLLMLDDDMKLEALPQTNNIKSIVTLEDKTDL